MDKRSLRLAGWLGILFSLLSLAVIPLSMSGAPPPALGASGTAFADWYREHRSGFLIGNYLGIVAFVPGFVQLAIVAAWVRRAEGEHGWLGSLVLATGAFAYAVFGCSLVLFQTLPFVVDPKVVVASEGLSTFAVIWFALDGLAALPFVIAVGWAALKNFALPRWFGYASAVMAPLGLVMSFGALTSEPAWLAAGGAMTALGFVGFFLWTGALSVICLRAPG